MSRSTAKKAAAAQPVSGAATTAAPVAAAQPVPSQERFGGIIPIRRVIRGVGPAVRPNAAASSAAAAASSSAAPSAFSRDSSAAAASVAPSASAVAVPAVSVNPSATNKLRTAFARESDEVIEARKAEARLPLRRLPGVFSPSGDGTPSLDYYGRTEGERRNLAIPARPEWRGRTAAQVEQQEQNMFAQWLERIYATYGAGNVNQFEHNLEVVWRQLWRVCERSDILLVVVDARNPLLGFPPSLYEYVTSQLKKPLLLVLNKIDLLPARVLADWVHYFQRRYPKLYVIPFTSFPAERRDELDGLARSKAKRGASGKGRTMLKPYGAKELLDACRRIVQENLTEDVPEAVRHAFSFEPSMLSGGSQAAEKNTEVYADAEDYMRASLDGDGDDGIGSSSLSLELKQLSERRAARKKEERKAALREKVRAANRALRAAGGGIAAAAGGDDDRIDEEEAEALAADEAHEHSDEEAADEQAVAANARQFSGALGVLEEDDHDSSKQQRRDDFITLGCIGQPNAGKSSLINALAGRKLLSVSIAPGHTKYLQTLFLNRATRLCDCPGLIAPATATGMPKAVQVLSGHFPIAQTRDPYSAVQFLAERMPLETIYKLSPPASSLHPPPAATSSASDSLAAPTSATIQQQQQQQQQHPPPFEWSAWAICEGVAQKKGFFNRQGAPDVYRAANLILREVLDGKIALYFTPPKD